MSLGTELGWISPMQPLLTSEKPPVGTKSMTLDDFAWLSSITYLGSVAGTFLWSFVADSYGRKLATVLVSIPYIISWTLILTAENIGWLLVARFISGIGSSGSRTNIVAFITEMADDDVRGFFGSIPVLFVDLGVLFSYTFGTYLKYHGVAAVGLAVPVVFLLTFIWVQESPVFLWKTGKVVEAQKSLLWYNGGDELLVEKTLLTYKRFPKVETKSLKALVATKGNRKALIIGLAIVLALQTSGYFIIVSYAVSIFESSGELALSPNDCSIFILSVQLIFSCITSLTIDRLGRRILLIGSEAVMTLTLLCLGYYFFMLNHKLVDSVFRFAPIILLSLHLAANGLKNPVALTLKGEIFAPEVKGLALSLLTLLNCLLSFVMVKMFPAARALLQLHGCFWILSGCSLFFTIFFAVYIPETKTKPQSLILLQLNGEDLDFSNKNMIPCPAVSYTGLINTKRSAIV